MIADDKYIEAMRRFSGDLRMTRQVFESMVQRDAPVTESHWRLLLSAHLDARDLVGAREVVERMRTAGIEPDASVRWDLVVATSRSGRTDEALQLLDQLHGEGLEPPADHAAAVLGIYVTGGRFPAARAVLRQMARRGQPATANDYERILEDCLQRRAIKDTRAVVDLMLEVNRAPAPDRASQLVAMMARAGHTERAHSLLERFRDAGVAVPGDVRTDLVVAHARAGDAAAAEGELAAMRAAGVEPTSFHHNAVLQARLASGDVEGAWAGALELSNAGRIPTGDNLESLIDVSLGAGRLRAASGVIDWMLLLGVPVPPQKAADIIARHLKAGELETAMFLFEVTVAHGVPADRRAARDIVERLVRAKRLDEARDWLERLRVSGTLTHGRHYGSLLAALVGAKRLEDAIAMLRHMLENKIVPTSADASKIVGGAVRTGQLLVAGELLDTLQPAGVSIDEPTFRELLWEHARKGEYEPAKAVYDRMVATGITPDDRHDAALRWASGETRRRLPEEGDGAGVVEHVPPQAAPADTEPEQPSTDEPAPDQAAPTDTEPESPPSASHQPPDPDPGPNPEPSPEPDPDSSPEQRATGT